MRKEPPPPFPSANLRSGVSGGREKDEKQRMVPLRLATLAKLPGDHVPVRRQEQDATYRSTTRHTRTPLGGREGDEIKKKPVD